MRNLLKYDFKYTWKVWWIGAIASLIATAFGISSLKHIYDPSLQNIYSSSAGVVDGLSISGILTFIIVLVGFILLIELMIMLRYYKNFFTDEGYLTFTLPVTEKTHLLAKSISGYVWIFVTAVIVGILACLFGYCAYGYEEGFKIANETIKIGVKLFFDDLGPYAVWYFAEVILMVLIGLLVNVQLGYLSITIGSIIAKKNKLLAGIGVYFAISMGFSLLTNVLCFFGLDKTYELNLSSHMDKYIAIGMGGIVVFLAVIAAGSYLLNLSLLKRKLNLA